MDSTSSFPGLASLRRLDVTASTQDDAKRLAAEGAPHGTLVWALRQTKGRGQHDRRWESPPGGLYVSLLLRPAFAPARLPEVSLAVAEAVRRALPVPLTIKAPNDLMHEGRKLGGILTESAGTESRVDWLIVGLGLNVNNPVPAEPPAVSLRQLAGREWPLEDVLRRVLRETFAWYASF